MTHQKSDYNLPPRGWAGGKTGEFTVISDPDTGAEIIIPTNYNLQKGDAWQKVFLMNLASNASVQDACRAAGIHPSAAYYMRQRDVDFANDWELALDAAVAVLEAEAYRRALAYSDNMLKFLLQSRKPSVYGNKLSVETLEPIQIEQTPYSFKEVVTKLLNDESE